MTRCASPGCSSGAHRASTLTMPRRQTVWSVSSAYSRRIEREASLQLNLRARASPGGCISQTASQYNQDRATLALITMGGLSAKYRGPLLGDTQSHRCFLYVLNARWRQPRWWFGTKRPVLHESTATAKAQHQPSIRPTGCAERAQQHQTSTKPRVCKQGDTGRGSDGIRFAQPDVGGSRALRVQQARVKTGHSPLRQIRPRERGSRVHLEFPS